MLIPYVEMIHLVFLVLQLFYFLLIAFLQILFFVVFLLYLFSLSIVSDGSKFIFIIFQVNDLIKYSPPIFKVLKSNVELLGINLLNKLV